MTKLSRREFIRDGVTAFTVSFAAPAFLNDIALAQGAGAEVSSWCTSAGATMP